MVHFSMARALRTGCLVAGALQLLAGWMPSAEAAEQPPVPSITETPEAVIVAFGSPDLAIPDAPRVNETSPRTVQLLGESLQRSGTPADRRAELVRDLGDTQLEEAVPYIRAALADADPLVRGAAAQAAGALGRAELAADVARLIDDAHPMTRAQAVVAHATLTRDRAEASPLILRALNDPSHNVRVAALLHAAAPQEADAIATALPSMQPPAQFYAVEALARMEARDHADAIAALLGGNPGQQVQALRALARLKSTRHSAAVLGLLDSPHPAVRREALLALPAVVDEAEARAAAERLLEDADASVRGAAAAGVAPVQSEAVARRLVALLADPYLPVHDAALKSLAAAGNEAVKALVVAEAVKLLEAPQARRRQDGSNLLGAYRSNAGLDKQIAILAVTAPTEAIDGAVVVETVTALGLIGDARAADAVLGLATRGAAAAVGRETSGDAMAGTAAADALVALARLGDRRVIEPARKVLGASAESTPAEPRAASAWALGEVGETGESALQSVLSRIYGSEFDAEETKFEALKAMGRLKLAGGRSTLQRAAGESSSPRVRWVATWSLWRLSGEAQPYVPPPNPWRADVAIEDMTR